MRSGSPLTVILSVTFVSKRFGVHVASTKILCELPIQSAFRCVSVSGVLETAACGRAAIAPVAAARATDVISMRRICSSAYSPQARFSSLPRGMHPRRMSEIVKSERHQR